MVHRTPRRSPVQRTSSTLPAAAAAVALAVHPWLAARASEVVSFEAPRTQREARAIAEHLSFEAARAELRAALAAAGVEVAKGTLTSLVVPAAKLAVSFTEPARTARARRLMAAREATIVATGWSYLALTPEDVATAAKLRAAVRRVAAVAVG